MARLITLHQEATLRYRTLTLWLSLSLLVACSDPAPPAQEPAPDAGDQDMGPQEDASPDAAEPDQGQPQDMGPQEDTGPDLPLGSVPLDTQSPWPRFRNNAAQTGRTGRTLTDDGSPLWAIATGRGVLSSPVVGADGTVYIGSADQTFYALRADGSERWRFTTAGVIKASALLDDRGRVYFGSGDGFLYALNAQSGQLLWKTQADDPAQNNAFLNWFDGNVGIGVDGTLHAPNSNFFLYGLNRENGLVRWRARLPDQTWSLPAVDVNTGHLYLGNNNVIEQLDNVFALSASGQRLWAQATQGSVAASPLLTGQETLVVGGFDGYVRALNLADGSQRWQFAARDHIFASPALLPDGGVIQPSADGTVYNLDASNGTLRWAFDWPSPIRSSPAIDGQNLIYMGTGDGHLLVLNADGSLRWALLLEPGERNDLNSSPALGEHAIYLASESGRVFGVPFDFCLREAEADNPNCKRPEDLSAPRDGARLRFVSRFGTLQEIPPAQVDGNDVLTFALSAYQDGQEILALLDNESLQVDVVPPIRLQTQISGNRRFVTLVPEEGFIGNLADLVQITLRGNYLVNPVRDGLRTEGGEQAGAFEEEFTFTVRQEAGGPLELAIPQQPGQPSGVLEMSRLAAPLPTLLPSYNQIGFDSLTYLVGMVEGSPERAIGWLVEARRDPETGLSRVTPGTRGVFPFIITYEDGLLTLNNQQGLTLEVLSATVSFQNFRVSTRLSPQGQFNEPAIAYASTVCGAIPLYGFFLQELGLCNPETDALIAYGAVLLERHADSPRQAPADIGQISLTVQDGALVAEVQNSPLSTSARSFGLLVLDATSGDPLPLGYGPDTRVEADGNGRLARLTLPLPDNIDLPRRARVYLMVDTYPAWRQEINLR